MRFTQTTTTNTRNSDGESQADFLLSARQRISALMKTGSSDEAGRLILLMRNALRLRQEEGVSLSPSVSFACNEEGL